MTGRRYTAAEKLKLTAAAERLRDKGLVVREISPLLGIPAKTLWRWVRTRHPYRPARVGYDTDTRCWRIYIYDPAREDDPQRGIEWWPLSWMCFATEEAARTHLSAAGEYEAAA